MTAADVSLSGNETVFAVLDAVEGHEEDLAGAIEELAPEVLAEDGCLTFRPYRSRGRPGRFYIYEVYADADTFQRHLATAHVSRFIDRLDRVSRNGRTAADPTAPLSINIAEDRP